MTSTHTIEFPVRLVKNANQTLNAMSFNDALKIDFSQWTKAEMERENKSKESKNSEEQSIPQFGAGSVYQHDLKEKIRRQKFATTKRKHNADEQPWTLKAMDKSAKNFRGMRKGSVSQHASYYIFTRNGDGVLEARLLNEWYDFQPIQRYKALSADEAEHHYERRSVILNHFAVMTQKRLKKDDGQPDDTKRNSANGFNIREDIYMDSNDESDSAKEDMESTPTASKIQKKKKKKTTNNRTTASKRHRCIDDEALDELVDSDDEGREKDYSESSESDDSDIEQQVDKDVAEQNGLRLSDGDSDEENFNDKGNDSNQPTKKAALVITHSTSPADNR